MSRSSRERVHPASMAAEGPLHELGAIAIVNSDSQGMGRMMETVRRTIQLAHVMQGWRRSAAGAGHPGLPPDGGDPFDSNERVLRYLAKVTIEPAITHGIAEHVGSLPPGRLADIVPVEPGRLRGQAGARPQGRDGGVGPARRGQRDRRAVASRPATGRTGAGRGVRRRRCRRRSCRPRARRTGACGRGSGDRADGRSRSRGTRGLTRLAGPQPGDRADRGRPRPTAASRWPAARSRSSRSATCRSTAGTCCADGHGAARRRRYAQMSPIVKPSGNGSLGSTT